MAPEDRAQKLGSAGRADYLCLVSPSAVKLFLHLAGLPDDTEPQTSEEIGAHIGLSRNTVDRARRELKALGWIGVTWVAPEPGHFPRWRADVLTPPSRLRRAAVDYFKAQLQASSRTLERKKERLRLARHAHPREKQQ